MGRRLCMAAALALALSGCAHQDLVKIVESEGLRIYAPTFSSLELDCGLEQDEHDRDIVFSCSAAFTLECLDHFDHSNIRGDHVSHGIRFGYDYSNDSIPDNRGQVGVFAFFDGQPHFALVGASDLLDSAAAHHGMAFAQYMIVFDGDTCHKWRSNAFQYRALCQKDSSLMVVESTDPVEYAMFVEMLRRANFDYAIYLDMGGWDDAWYRIDRRHIHRISRGCYPLLTNWLVFKQ